MSATIGQRRRREPRYDVFELRALHGPMMHAVPEDGAPVPPPRDGERVDAWVLIAENVRADKRTEAIVYATRDRPEGSRYGTFATVRVGEFKSLVRAKRVVERDDWSDPSEGAA